MEVFMKALIATNLKKYYGKKDNLVKALDGVNLQVEQGEFVAIVGTSGSGKSTLLHMLGGLDIATEGSVLVQDKALFELREDELAVFRRRNIGFVFQNFNLIPILNVYENIILPIELDGKTVDEDHINAILNELGLKEKIYALPNTLSGGQKQRVALARALATKPAIILADEPTGNLDSKTSQEVMGLLKTSGEKFNQTIIMITHNEALAQLCDRTIHLEDGKIINGLESHGEYHEY